MGGFGVAAGAPVALGGVEEGESDEFGDGACGIVETGVAVVGEPYVAACVFDFASGIVEADVFEASAIAGEDEGGADGEAGILTGFEFDGLGVKGKGAQ